jgi:hypothetical protein
LRAYNRDKVRMWPMSFAAIRKGAPPLAGTCNSSFTRRLIYAPNMGPGSKSYVDVLVNVSGRRITIG